jgi:hypothetical protein
LFFDRFRGFTAEAQRTQSNIFAFLCACDGLLGGSGSVSRGAEAVVGRWEIVFGGSETVIEESEMMLEGFVTVIEESVTVIEKSEMMLEGFVTVIEESEMMVGG